MKYIIIFSCLTFSILTTASVDNMINIQGQISNAFDKNQVKIIDNNQQTYFLSKKLFPKNFKFSKGNKFSIEVTEKEFESFSIKPAKPTDSVQ